MPETSRTTTSGVPGERLRPAVFLDRDGTLIREREYLADPDGVELVPGAADALRRLRAAGFVLVVVTNQSGIGRGYYTEDDYRAVAERIESVLRAEGASVDGTYYSPYHPDDPAARDRRKPATGMFLEAIRDHGIDPARSYFVGDRMKDVVPARALGGRGILVRTGYGRGEEDGADSRTWVADDLPAAAELILEDAAGDAGRGD